VRPSSVWACLARGMSQAITACFTDRLETRSAARSPLARHGWWQHDVATSLFSGNRSTMSDESLPSGTDSDVYKTLLESTKAIPWRIDWQSMTFSYIGPQIEQLLGWEQGSWVGINDWVERMHPDDRDTWSTFACRNPRPVSITKPITAR